MYSRVPNKRGGVRIIGGRVGNGSIYQSSGGWNNWGGVLGEKKIALFLCKRVSVIYLCEQ